LGRGEISQKTFLKIVSMVFISEALPNPVGKDTEGEFVELFNSSDKEVSLASWSLKDAGGKSYLFKNESITARGFLWLPYSKTKISLNNDGETISLFDGSGELVDSLSYQDSLGEGTSLIKSNLPENYLKTNRPTPGEQNVFLKSENGESFLDGNKAIAENLSSGEIVPQPLSSSQVLDGSLSGEVMGVGIFSVFVLTFIFWYAYRKIQSV